jgi:ATP-binding protein involved in chromosome partitioning
MNDSDIRAALAPFKIENRLDGVHVQDGLVQISLTATREEAAALEPMRRDIEAALRALPGVQSASVILTSHAKQAAPVADSLLPGVKKIIAVASGKGGVGKSTVAVNVAVALAQSGLSVGLLDADIYGPSVPRMLGADAQPEVRGGRITPIAAWGLKIMSMGFLVPEDKALVWRGPMVMGAINQMLGQVEWGTLDVLVVDMPPGTGDAQLTLAQKAKPHGAVIVSTPQDISLLDARRGIKMFEQVNVPVLGIIENMSFFSCPNCGHHTNIFGHGGARAEAERLAVPFLGEIPLQLAIRESGDAGTPITASAPDGDIAAAFRAVAASLRAALAV